MGSDPRILIADDVPGVVRVRSALAHGFSAPTAPYHDPAGALWVPVISSSGSAS